MKASEAIKYYTLYTRFHTKKGKDLLLIQRLCDPVTQDVTSMLVVDLDKQQEMKLDFDKWHEANKAGDIWRVQPK